MKKDEKKSWVGGGIMTDAFKEKAKEICLCSANWRIVYGKDKHSEHCLVADRTDIVSALSAAFEKGREAR